MSTPAGAKKTIRGRVAGRGVPVKPIAKMGVRLFCRSRLRHLTLVVAAVARYVQAASQDHGQDGGECARRASRAHRHAPQPRPVMAPRASKKRKHEVSNHEDDDAQQSAEEEDEEDEKQPSSAVCPCVLACKNAWVPQPALLSHQELQQRRAEYKQLNPSHFRDRKCPCGKKCVNSPGLDGKGRPQTCQCCHAVSRASEHRARETAVETPTPPRCQVHAKDVQQACMEAIAPIVGTLLCVDCKGSGISWLSMCPATGICHFEQLQDI
jgi:hypothetical protein